MKLYSFEEAQYLKEFYTPKIINKIADEKLVLRITNIELKEFKKDFYALSCSGYLINNSSVAPTISLESVLETMNLENPEFVLQRLNQ